MAAPTPTTRATPAGIKLEDGYSTLYTFALDANIELWEKTVKPPGLDGGDAIDTTTMHNVDLRTFSPRNLVTMTEGTFKAAYDPVVYTSVLQAVNRRDTVTARFPDGSTVAFYGYLRMFEPDEHQEGTMPEATVTIQPTNWDHVNDVEATWAVSQVAGT